MLRLVPLALLALPGLASAAPDYRIGWASFHCSSATRRPVMEISLVNDGDFDGQNVRIDVWHPWANPAHVPVLGALSPRFVTVLAVPAGDGRIMQINMPNAFRADQYVYVRLDPMNLIAESDETNNDGLSFAHFAPCL